MEGIYELFLKFGNCCLRVEERFETLHLDLLLNDLKRELEIGLDGHLSSTFESKLGLGC